MRHHRLAVAILLVLLMTTLTVSAQVVTEEPGASQVLPAAPTAQALPTVVGEITYVVRPGDTLFRIAVRYKTTVRALAEANNIVNPSLIYAGQTLRIPGVVATPTPTPIPVSPTATLVPQPTQEYIVRPGDTLFRIAVRYKTTIRNLVALNPLIRNPNIIYVGQRLNVPTTSGQIIPTATPGGAALVPTAQQGGGAALVGYGFAYGIEAYMVDQDVSALTAEITSLNMGWVKQVINWRDFEPVQGQIDFATLDTIVDSLNAAGVNILFTVTTSPAWARTSTEESGPPDDFTTYGTFIAALASRYAGRVQAYEIWNEPNLRREWNSTTHPISAASYSQLLSIAYAAVKGGDSSAVVLSAGLAPTGFNDGVNAINDRQYLRDLYTSNLVNISDAVGAHPLGWANPPDSVCCTAPVGVETHYQDPTFFFRNTLEDYRQIMVAANDGSTPIWVTKFGWGSSEDTAAPSQNNIFFSYTSLGEQAIYNPRGFELGAELGFVGPMFLNNLNGCAASMGAESCYYSLIGPNGPRPVFDAIASLNADQPAPDVTEEAVTLPGEIPTQETAIDPAVPTLETMPLPMEITPEVTPDS